MPKEIDHLAETKRLMGSLMCQPPKLHEDMKLGKAKTKETKKPARKKRGASTKPENA